IVPSDRTLLGSILQLDPYLCRAEGLDRELSNEEFARALIHLNARRGFQSNRRMKKNTDKESGQIKQEIRQHDEAMAATGSRTIGEYLYKHVQNRVEHRRKRHLGRAAILDEFNQLWVKQA